jgi:hypothetical protein
MLTAEIKASRVDNLPATFVTLWERRWSISLQYRYSGRNIGAYLWTQNQTSVHGISSQRFASGGEGGDLNPCLGRKTHGCSSVGHRRCYSHGCPWNWDRHSLRKLHCNNQNFDLTVNKVSETQEQHFAAIWPQGFTPRESSWRQRPKLAPCHFRLFPKMKEDFRGHLCDSNEEFERTVSTWMKIQGVESFMTALRIFSIVGGSVWRRVVIMWWSKYRNFRNYLRVSCIKVPVLNKSNRDGGITSHASNVYLTTVCPFWILATWLEGWTYADGSHFFVSHLLGKCESKES